ncbi:MAG: glycosyltransferase family 2 protein [Synergistaceae bacterium]|nr:glycosyltransferase family 2 protein [Synergistaceae bacterium]
MKPVVSFCIPVYNNAEGAVKIVGSLLSSQDERFEVVVSDDNSRDNVGELLSGIHDERFKYFKNEKNLGAHKNWEHSLELGKGEWLYLIMGRDIIDGGSVSNLIGQLIKARENNIVFLKDDSRKYKDFKISEGIDAMIDFIKYNHPTGCIFRSDLFGAIPNRTHYFEISDMYPELYVIRDMVMKGKCAIICSGVNRRFMGSDLVKVKSSVECGMDISKTYFSPSRRTRQFFEQLDMVESDLQGVFTLSELDRYFKERYVFFLENVSYWWRMWNKDPELMAHYGQPIRHVSIREMARNIIQGYKDTTVHLKEKGTYTPSRRRIMLCITSWAVVRLCTKSAIKSVLEPLGVWKILHRIRHKGNIQA